MIDPVKEKTKEEEANGIGDEARFIWEDTDVKVEGQEDLTDEEKALIKQLEEQDQAETESFICDSIANPDSKLGGIIRQIIRDAVDTSRTTQETESLSTVRQMDELLKRIEVVERRPYTIINTGKEVS